MQIGFLCQGWFMNTYGNFTEIFDFSICVFRHKIQLASPPADPPGTHWDPPGTHWDPLGTHRDPLEYYQPNSKMMMSKLHKNGKHYSDTHFTTKSNVTSFIDLQKHLSEEPTHWDPLGPHRRTHCQWVRSGSPVGPQLLSQNSTWFLHPHLKNK